MAKKKVQITAEPVRRDPYQENRDKILNKVKSKGYDVFYDGSILTIRMKPEDAEDTEKIEKAKETIINTGYDSSYGITFH